jgi:hypothetical protein
MFLRRRALKNRQHWHFDRRKKTLTMHDLSYFSSLTLLETTKFKPGLGDITPQSADVRESKHRVGGI